jgi:hypothetical protein
MKSSAPRTAWHSLSAAEALSVQESRPEGLSGAEAAERLARHGPNHFQVSRPVSAWVVLWIRWPGYSAYPISVERTGWSGLGCHWYRPWWVRRAKPSEQSGNREALLPGHRITVDDVDRWCRARLVRRPCPARAVAYSASCSGLLQPHHPSSRGLPSSVWRASASSSAGPPIR